MAVETRIDAAGRVVIPKELRDKYGLNPGRSILIIAMPDGVSIVPQQRERRFIRRGPILAIDLGVESAKIEEFDVDRMRDEHLSSKQP